MKTLTGFIAQYNVQLEPIIDKRKLLAQAYAEYQYHVRSMGDDRTFDIDNIVTSLSVFTLSASF